MDRQSLAAWSLDLNCEDYSRALAALGVLEAARSSRKAPVPALLDELAQARRQLQPGILARLFQARRQADGTLAWRYPSSVPRKRAASAEWPSARIMAEAWQQFLGITGPCLRLSIMSRGTGLDLLLGCMRMLRHSSVGVRSVFVGDLFKSDGLIDWRWPFTFAVLPGDRLADAFREEQTRLPEPWPYRFVTVDREHPRSEILVCSESLPDALARVIRGRSRHRTSLVMVLGGMGESRAPAEHLLQTLASELSVEGAALLEPPLCPAEAMQALRYFGDALTHNFQLDMALRDTFANDVIALLNHDLIRLSRLGRAVDNLATRLKRLPEMSAIRLSEKTVEKLRLTLEEAPPVPVGAEPELPPTLMAPVPPPPARTARAVRPVVLAARMEAERESYRYVRESDEATALSEVSERLSEHEAAERRQAETPRFIQHRLLRKLGNEYLEEQRRLEVGVPVMLKVRIGPRDEAWQADPSQEPFPEYLLPKRSNRLQVMFFEPGQLDRPILREIVLPVQGASSEAEFVFTPRQAAPFQGRITVLYQGRVLQTSLVLATVTGAGAPEGRELRIDHRIEARVRNSLSDLDSRRAFDMALVFNHAVGERPMLTALSGKRAWASDLTGINEPVARINAELSNVATSVDDYAKGLLTPDNEALFARLARIGANLYSRLFLDQLRATESGGINLEEEKYIQVVSTRPDAVVPLEFVYQYGLPKAEAKICPNAVKALKNEKCSAPCPRSEHPRDYVCPLGFWGLSKVIERHVFNPKLKIPEHEGLSVLAEAEPLEHRDRLELDRGAVLGYSKEVADDQAGALAKLLKRRFKSRMSVAKNWDDWRSAVKSRKPTLLVALPHNQGSEEEIELEIRDDFLETLRLPTERDFVHVEGEPYPLVMLLGCDVASTAQQYASHIGYFRQAGAAAVISTIATVFGGHAARVGEKIVGLLLKASGKPDSRLGEVLLQVKREAVAGSLPMALCIVAFGDADWRL